MPLVTVVIPVYNRARLLAQALESLRAQTFRDFEVVVSDNASEEKLGPVVAHFEDLPIRYYRVEKQIPFLENFSRGANLCRTEFLKFLCSDDLLLPNALADLVNTMADHPKAGLCLGGCIIFTDHSGMRPDAPVQVKASRLPPAIRPRTPGQWMGPDGFFVEGNLSYSLTPTACLYRTRCFQEVGGINRGIAAIFDWEIFVTMSSHYEVARVAQPVCAFREHPEQWTNAARSGDRFLRDVFWITSQANPFRSRLGISGMQQFYWRLISGAFVWTDALRALRHPRPGQGSWWQTLRRSLALVPWLHRVLPLPLLPVFWLLEKLRARNYREGQQKENGAFLPTGVDAPVTFITAVLEKWSHLAFTATR